MQLWVDPQPFGDRSEVQGAAKSTGNAQLSLTQSTSRSRLQIQNLIQPQDHN